MYAACGSMKDAKHVFEKVPLNSVFPWNSLLRGAVVNGRHSREAIGVSNEMSENGIDGNAYTFSCLIKSIASSKALRKGRKVHEMMLKNGLLSEIMLRTCLMDMYFKCGKVALARQMFDEIPEQDRFDVVLWSSLVSGFANNRMPNCALEFFRNMVFEGVVPNSATLKSVLPVCGDVGVVKFGKEVHCFAVKCGYFENGFIQSAVIDMYCKCGKLSLARKVFYGCQQRNAVMWTALMSGYAHNCMMDKALKSVIWMQQEKIQPDAVTVATVLPVCGELKALRSGKEIHCYAVKNEFFPNVAITTSLIVMYSKCGEMSYSLSLFETMENKNVISWTALIGSLARDCRYADALDVFRLMQVSKHRPDAVKMMNTLNICGQIGELRMGRELHAQVLKKALEHTAFVSAELTRLYAKCRRICDARLVFDTNPWKGVITWTAIIEAYALNGAADECLALFDQMKSEDCEPNEFTYDVLTSICHRAGLREEEERFIQLRSRLD